MDPDGANGCLLIRVFKKLLFRKMALICGGYGCPQVLPRVLRVLVMSPGFGAFGTDYAKWKEWHEKNKEK